MDRNETERIFPLGIILAKIEALNQVSFSQSLAFGRLLGKSDVIAE